MLGADKLRPNYNSVGLSQCMGKELREEVEQQLLNDLEKYEVPINNLSFDWSDSCIGSF